MSEVLGAIAMVIAAIAATMIITWGLGAFVTWDTGWAFVSTDARIGYLVISFLVALFAGLISAT